MSSDQILALNALMRALEGPLKTYNRHLRKAWRTDTDTPENPAAREKGDAALLEIEQVVRAWVTKHPEHPADFTDARDAFFQIGMTPALQGLRTELRIEGRPPLVGRYAGAGMRRAKNLDDFMVIEPMLLFPHGDEETHVVADDSDDPEHIDDCPGCEPAAVVEGGAR